MLELPANILISELLFFISLIKGNYFYQNYTKTGLLLIYPQEMSLFECIKPVLLQFIIIIIFKKGYRKMNYL